MTRKLTSSLTLFPAILLFLLVAAGAQAQSVNELIRRTDSLARVGNFDAAKNTIEQAHKIESRNYDVLWRLSKCLADAADSLKSDDAKEAMFLRARAAADSALAVRKNGMNAYVRRAIANGKLGLFRGVFSVGELVQQVRDDCEKAIDLNNDSPYVLALAHYILGRLHMKVSEKPYLVRWPLGLGFADIDDAIDHLGEAAKIQPNNIRFRIDYARALIREDEYDDARAQLNKIAELTPEYHEDTQFKREAVDLLREIKDE